MNVHPRDRYNEILQRQVNTNSMRYKLEQSGIGRIVLAFFDCCCCGSFYDPTYRQFKADRAFLYEQRNLVTEEDFPMWQQAARKVNKYVPFYRVIHTKRYNPQVRVQRAASFQPHYQPRQNPVVHVNHIGHAPYVAPVTLNNQPTFNPVRNSVPSRAGSVTLNTQPTHNPALNAPPQPLYTQRTTYNSRPTSAPVAQRIVTQPHFAPPPNRPVNAGGFVAQNIVPPRGAGQVNARPPSANPLMTRTVNQNYKPN